MTAVSEPGFVGGFEITEGDRVLIARSRAGLNQKQLGAMTRMSYQTVGSIENGGPIMAIRRQNLARALGVTEEWLMTGQLPLTTVGTQSSTGEFNPPYLRLHLGKGDSQPVLPSLVAVR